MRGGAVWLAVGIGLTAAALAARSELSGQTRSSPVLVALVLVGLALLWFLYRSRRRRIRDWQDAEAAAARWLRRAGCRRVALTGGSADGGIDVITQGWAVQVKHTTKRVGRPAIQQLVGASLDVERSPALFSTSGFSGPGVDYANDHDVALFELDLDGSAHGVNRASRRVGKRTRRLLRR